MAEEVVIRLKGDDEASDDLKRVIRALRQTEEETEDVGDEAVKSARKTKKLEKGLSALKGAAGVAVSALGAAAVAGAALSAVLGVKAVRAAGDFQAAITASTAKVDGSIPTLNAFRDAAIEAGVESAFSAKQAADGLGFLAQAGFDATEATEALPDTLSLAAAANMELAEAADIASNVLSGMNLEVAELGRVNDVLIKTANSANTSVSQMGEAMKMVAPVGASMGVSLEQLSAAVGQLSNAGLQATQAGTGVRQILAKMAAPTDKLTQLQKKLGVEFTNSEGRLRDFNTVMRELEEAGIQGEEAMAAFGPRAGTALAALLGQGTDALDELTVALEEAGGTAEFVEKQQLNTFNGAIQVLKGSFDTLMITIGEAFLPILQGAAEQMTGFVNKVRGAVSASGQLETVGAQVAREFAKFLRVSAPMIDTIGYMSGLVVRLTSGWMDLADGVALASTKLEQFEAAKSGDLRGIFEARVAGEQIKERMRQRHKEMARLHDMTADLGDMARNAAQGLEGIARGADQDAEKKRRLASIRDEVVGLQEELQFGGHSEPMQEAIQERIDALNEMRQSLATELGMRAQDLSLGTGGGGAEQFTMPEETTPTVPTTDGGESPVDIAKKAREETQKGADAALKEANAIATRNDFARQKLAILRESDQLKQAELRHELRLAEIRADEDMTEAERDLERERAKLELADAQADARQRAAEAEAQLSEETQRTVAGLRDAASALRGSGAPIASDLAPVVDVFADIKEGEAAAADALGAVGQATAGFAEQMGASAGAQAAILALFETAMGFATLFTNPAASAGHFIAAANFGLVSAIGGGQNKGGAAGGGGIGPGKSGGAGKGAGQIPDPREAAEITGRVLAEQMGGEIGGPDRIEQTFDFSGATLMEDSPEVQKRVRKAGEQGAKRLLKRKAG